jgi:shikimate kinase
MPERHLVLVGLPGAGKSTVGPRVAQALGREFVDLDAEIERAAGRTIPEIFARDGEAAFRALERAESRALLAPGGRPVVLAPGGGWIEDAANRALLGREATGVYLAVSPGVALARMGAAVEGRPLLAGDDPAKKLSELAHRRNPLYLQCQHTVSVDSMTPDQVVSSIVALASQEIGD